MDQFLCKNWLFLVMTFLLMKSISFNYCVSDVLSKKPMATHQASINIQEPTKFKLEATRTRVEYSFHLELDKLSNPSAIRKPSSTNSSKNSPSSRISNQNPQKLNLESTDLNHGGFCSSDDKLSNRRCGNLRPEGNIQPNPLVFFSLLSF